MGNEYWAVVRSIELRHHGVKGQKWGVRRTPEELGHAPIAKSKKNDIIRDGIYYSPKGFTVAGAKLTKYCLDPGKKHSKEFFDVGYTPEDAELLFQHIEKGYDIRKRTGKRLGHDNAEQFSIPMRLGVTKKRMFLTCWQIDYEGAPPRLTSAYRDSRYDSQDHSDEEDEM